MGPRQPPLQQSWGECVYKVSAQGRWRSAAGRGRKNEGKKIPGCLAPG
jgi:hypothetical protein